MDSEKVSDHYAIILTEEKVNPLTLPKGEQQIYDLIAKSIIATHYPDYIYDTTGIIITVAEKFGFRSSGTLVKEEGWKKIY
ncbi:DNA topoisomerase, partial [Escherichia coli]|nr:DNA topoisomerase [Escherichia coli]